MAYGSAQSLSSSSSSIQRGFMPPPPALGMNFSQINSMPQSFSIQPQNSLKTVNKNN